MALLWWHKQLDELDTRETGTLKIWGWVDVEHITGVTISNTMKAGRRVKKYAHTHARARTHVRPVLFHSVRVQPLRLCLRNAQDIKRIYPKRIGEKRFYLITPKGHSEYSTQINWFWYNMPFFHGPGYILVWWKGKNEMPNDFDSIFFFSFFFFLAPPLHRSSQI